MLTIISAMNHDIVMFDVGHGDCVLLKKDDHTPVLIDCGAKYPHRFSHIPNIIEKEAEDGAFGLILSHYHSDHYSLFAGFSNPHNIAKIYIPELPMVGPQSEIGFAVKEFLHLAALVRYKKFRLLPEIFKHSNRAAVCCQAGDTIPEAGLNLRVIWPDLSSQVLQTARILNRARAVRRILRKVSQMYSLPIPEEQKEESMKSFLWRLMKIDPRELNKTETRKIQNILRFVEETFNDELANYLSLVFRSSDQDLTHLLFLGDAPRKVLDIIDVGSSRYDLIKAAHHGTEFGSSLGRVDADFLLISRNRLEFPMLQDIDYRYLNHFASHVLSSESLGSCYLRGTDQNRTLYGDTWSAGTILYFREGTLLRFLIMRRKLSSTWDFPMGKRKSIDRSPRETALRETKEETGIDAIA